MLQKEKKPDVIILARGGGSIEDLMPFNSEKIAYEIFKSKIPIISGIGHETDFTIADFVADHRASTPTAAADLVVPEKKEIELKINGYDKNLNLNIHRIISYKKSKEKQLRIINPRKLVENNIIKLESILLQFFKTIKFKLAEKKNNINLLSLKTPWFLVKIAEKNLNKNKNINDKIIKILLQKKNNLKSKIDILNSSSYEKWLKKGFALVKDKEDKLIKDINNLSIQDKVNIKIF